MDLSLAGKLWGNFDFESSRWEFFDYGRNGESWQRLDLKEM